MLKTNIHYTYHKMGVLTVEKTFTILGPVTRESILALGPKHKKELFRWSRDKLELYTVVRNNRERFCIGTSEELSAAPTLIEKFKRWLCS